MNFIRAGFRTIRTNPALIFAEIAWRWAFGAAAWLLMIFTVRTILEGVDVSGVEIALARSNDAYLIADALVRVIVQVLPRFLGVMFIAIPLLAVIWVVAATIGRAVTIRNLVTDGRAGSQPAVPPASGRRTISLGILNAVRAVFSLTTVLAFFGTVVLVSASIGPSSTPEAAPGYVLAWLFLALLVGCFWGLVNWFLALAPIFIVRDGSSVWNGIRASVGLYRDHHRDYVSIATWFGFFRAAALLLAVIAGLASLGAGWRAGLIASAVIALFYFAVADALYIARLAAYVELATPAPALTVPSDIAAATPPSDVSHLELET